MRIDGLKICMHDGCLTTTDECQVCGCANSLRSLSTMLKSNNDLPVRLFRMLDNPDILSIRNVRFCYKCGDIQPNSNNKVCEKCGSKELIPLKDTL